MQFVEVDLKIRLAATGCRTKIALEDWLVARMNELVCLQTVALGEACVTNITFIWFLSRVDTHVTLQLVCIWTSITAMRTLETKAKKKITHSNAYFVQIFQQ